MNQAITKKDLKEALASVAKTKDLAGVAGDLVRVEKKIDRLTEAVNKKPDREEFPQLLDRVLEYTTLKIEHDHVKKVIREKLGVEI
jgi:hypothetical protein